MSRPPLPPIDFRALAAALLARAHDLVPAWISGGVIRGSEYFCGSIEGGEGTSCAINLAHGRWSDFNTGEKGGDLLDLYAQIHGLELGAAALKVAREEGLESVAGIVSTPGGPPSPPPPPRPPTPAAPAREPEGWRTVMPVPANALAATFRHGYRQREDITHVAEYRVGEHLLGYVVRFRTSDGGKETLPYTWCISARDGTAKWNWRQWDENRPLFYPGRAHPEGRTVVVVEGEKKAETLQAVLDAGAAGVYCVVTWPGGCKAWQKALWSWVKGSTVLLWPDCDAKRLPLPKADKAKYTDDVALAVAVAAQPLLPVEKQPGMAAMLAIGAHLRDEQECAVSLLPIPAPGAVADGWDCGDAITTDGWDFEKILAFFGRASTLSADVAAPPAKPAKAASPAAVDEAQPEKDDDGALPWWLEMFVDDKTGSVRMTRKTVIACLRNAPDLEAVLGYNELSGEVTAREPWPWRREGGPVVDNDDLRLGDWLSTKYKVPGTPRAALTEAMHTVADSRPYHPVREYLKGLKHDGKPRLDKWLIHVLGIDHELLANGRGDEPANPKRLKYLQMVSRFWLIGMVARIMKPGCKFDYSLVLEGLTGRRKSTLLEVMAGKTYYSDTHFDIGGNKDGFDQLQGLWLYELSEMSALRKADSEQVKAFFSSASDRYRASYGRYVQNHPRQCVIGCTTNKRQYLYDMTGNRRFWPVWIDQPIKIEWFVKWRDELFAEALAAYEAGERFAPTLEEEEAYFVPEQEARLVETGVQGELLRLLTRAGAANGEAGDSTLINELTKFVTLPQLVKALGTDIGKSTTVLEGQIRSWLEAQGWERKRAGSGAVRPYGWARPKVWPAPIEEPDSCPAPGASGDDHHRQAQAVSTEGDDDLPI